MKFVINEACNGVILELSRHGSYQFIEGSTKKSLTYWCDLAIDGIKIKKIQIRSGFKESTMYICLFDNLPKCTLDLSWNSENISARLIINTKDNKIEYIKPKNIYEQLKGGDNNEKFIWGSQKETYIEKEENSRSYHRVPTEGRILRRSNSW